MNAGALGRWGIESGVGSGSKYTPFPFLARKCRQDGIHRHGNFARDAIEARTELDHIVADGEIAA